MPRVRINRLTYKVNDLYDYIRGEMKRQKISQKQMAAVLKIEQANFSKHLNNKDFKTVQLMEIFHYLKTSQDQIGRMMFYEA